MDKEGKVYGINFHKNLFVRDGVTSSRPTGTNWRHIPSRPLVHISAGYSKIVALDSRGSIYYYGGNLFLVLCSINVAGFLNVCGAFCFYSFLLVELRWCQLSVIEC